MKKIPNSLKAYLAMFWLGILAGMACRLSDIFPYDSLWSLSSIASLFGFWIASAGAITWPPLAAQRQLSPKPLKPARLSPTRI